MTAPVEGPAPQQCGRCRKLFDGDATLNPDAIPDWWLCPPCRAALLPGHEGDQIRAGSGPTSGVAPVTQTGPGGATGSG